MSNEQRAVSQDLEHAAWAAFLKDMPDEVRKALSGNIVHSVWRVGYYKGLQDGHAYCHQNTEAALTKFGEELQKALGIS